MKIYTRISMRKGKGRGREERRGRERGWEGGTGRRKEGYSFRSLIGFVLSFTKVLRLLSLSTFIH